METIISEWINDMGQAYKDGGWLALMCVFLIGAVNLWQFPAIQSQIPEFLRWDALSKRDRFLFVVGASFVGSAASAIQSGTKPLTAATEAISVAITSAIVHVLALKPLAKSTTEGAAKLPPRVSKALSIIVPWDKEKLAKIREDATK